MKKKFLLILSLILTITVSINAQNAWINEIHYDNVSTDVDELIEVVIENAGAYTLSDFQIDFYNGNGGVTYFNSTLDLFVEGATVGNYTFYTLTNPGVAMQNGSPDGLALSYMGVVISGQFLSYEGTFAATDGPAIGVTSTDIGVFEDGTTLVGQSLQLIGSGASYSDFSWSVPITATAGALNTGQAFGAANDQTSTVTAPGTQLSAGILSSINVDSVPVFRFVITDAAGGDGLATNVTGVKLFAGVNNTIDFNNNLSGGGLYDITNGAVIPLTGQPTVNADNVLLPIALTIPDGGSVELEGYVYINNMKAPDGGVLQFQINSASHGFTADVTGSGFEDPFAGGDITGNNFTVEVVGTQLGFTQEPTNVVVGQIMTPAVEIGATDIYGNTDVDFAATSLTLTFNGTGIMSGTASQTTVSGVAVFNDLSFDTEETAVNLTVSGAFTGATSVNFNIVPDVNTLFFSEYLEGSSLNKAIEIYNGTGADVDLSLYSVNKATNGGGWGATPVALSGTLAAGDVYVIANSGAVIEILNQADLIDGIASFNGDDAMGLFYNGNLVDVIGDPNVDPGAGWVVSGVTDATANHTIVRKYPDIMTGNTDWVSSAANEWDVYNSDDFTYIGWHGVPPATPPTITNVVHTPASPTSVNTVSVSADVIDEGTITSVTLNWGTVSGSLTNSINMTLSAGSTYTTDTDIPAQIEGTIVYYEVVATDNDATSTTTAEFSYTVIAVPVPNYTTLPYTEDFSVDLGLNVSYSVLGATKEWYHDATNFNASCNGFNSGETEEDWLILPGINLDNYSNEIMNFDSEYQFGIDDPSNYLKLMFSTDYDGVSDPTLATWTQLTYTQPSAELTWQNSGNIDLSAITGTSVFIAFKYHYQAGSYRKWSVDNFYIYENIVTIPTKLVITDVSPASPFVNQMFDVTVQAQDNANIAGNVDQDTEVQINLTTGNGTITGTVTGIILNGTSDVVITGLSYDMVESININASVNTGMALTSSADFAINVIALPVVSIPYNNDFESGSLYTDGWTTQLVLGSLDWYYDTFNGDFFAEMSNFDGVNNPGEAWLISPAVNLSGASTVYFNFMNACNFTGADIEVYVSSDYDGYSLPSSATWNMLSPALSTGSYVDVFSGDLDISAYAGGYAYVAFKYTGTDVDGKTWQIDDVNIYEPAGNPTLTITSPTEGQTLTSSDVTVTFTVENFIVGDNTSGTDDGHIHYSLDGGGEVMIYTTDPINLTSLADGAHTLNMWLVDNTHTPLDPPVEATVNFTIDTSGAVGDIEQNISVYPNPTNGTLTINTDNKITNVEIYNVTGQKVAEFNNANQINISDLGTGIYILKAQDSSKNLYVQRIIKQ